VNPSDNPWGGWPGQDPRSWGGWAPHDPRWGHRAPVHPNQLGTRMPSGGPPPPGLGALWLALALLVASPLVLVSWLVGQAVLRATGWRPWKVATCAAAAIVAVVVLAGGPEQALVLHFAGYLTLLNQVGKPIVHAPLPGQFLIPQLPLSIPAGLLLAAVNVMGRPRPAIDPAEVRRTQRAANRRMTLAIQRAASVRDDHWDTPALGAGIDGDLGWTTKAGLVVVPPKMQARSRLIVGTSGMGKSVDVEREAFLAARAGRKFFLVDGKGTDPEFVERALAGYLWGHPHARVALWPELPMDGWRGSPAALHNRLMAMLGWTEPYYKDVASLLLRLALHAPSEDGPVRSSAQLMARMDPERLTGVYEHRPDRLREARSLCGRDQARAVQGAIGRFANFFAAVAGGFDAGSSGWSYETVDFGYFRAPYLAGRDDADACCRLLLEDFAHYATLRKPRQGEDATLVFDEFSAIAGGRETAIQLVERVRDAGCAVYLSAQSADGLGDEAQQRRLVGACSGGMLLHAMPTPAGLLQAAGMVKVVEQTWRLDPAGPTGNSSARIGERPKIDPGAVQQGREGEAWLIARGRYEHLMVARTAISDGWRARARALVALARSLRPDEALPGARAWRDAQQAATGALAGLAGHLAIEPPPTLHDLEDRGPDDGGPLPTSTPRPPTGPGGPAEHAPAHGPVAAARSRLRLAVAAAARQGDRETTMALLAEAERRGLPAAELLAVAERYWPRPALPRRLGRAGRRWTAAQLRRAVRYLRHTTPATASTQPEQREPQP
jgi:hypothetical protein